MGKRVINSVSKIVIIAITIGVVIGIQKLTANELPASAEEIRPLLVGARVPEMVLTAADGGPFDLNKAISEKPTVLIYYRGGWCPYCNMQLNSLMEIEQDLIQMGYQIIAVSADRYEKVQDTIKKHNQNYTILSDNDMAGAKAFGIAFQVDEKTLSKYEEYGINLEDASGLKHHILPVPAVFIITTDGVIKFEYVNPDYKVRLDADVLLAAARSALKPDKQKPGKK